MPVFWKFLNDEELLEEDGFKFVKDHTNEFGPFDLHFAMFIMAINLQASNDQFAEFMPQAMDFRMIGCYA